MAGMKLGNYISDRLDDNFEDILKEFIDLQLSTVGLYYIMDLPVRSQIAFRVWNVVYRQFTINVLRHMIWQVE